jgi:hypothetical protein
MQNPLFDTREYEFEFSDGTHEKYQANVILTKNMFAQVHSERGQPVSPFTGNHGPQKGSQRSPDIGGGRAVHGANGQAKKPKVTTRGRFLLVHQWKDGSIIWEKLKDLKASNPVEVAE